MKKLLSMILCVLICSVCFATAEQAMIANPWTDCTREEMAAEIGIDMEAPAEAEDPAWSYMVSGEDVMGDLRFTAEGVRYCYRIAPAAEFTDISGLYYDWTIEDEDSVSYCDAATKRVITEDEGTIDLVLWFDVVPGVMYSLSAQADDLDGFDILAMAEELFVPMQGEAD